MKEFSTEEMAQAYRISRENAIYEWECGLLSRETLEFIFPELTENKNEMIIKTIKSLIESGFDENGSAALDYNISKEDCLAWIEKYENEIQEEYRPESCGNDDLTAQAGADNSKSFGNCCTEDRNGQQDIVCEKVVKPEFHINDFIISNNTRRIYKVKEVRSSVYILEDLTDDEECRMGIAEADESCILWTINEALPGDILVSKDGHPFIYNGHFDSFHVGAYCGLDFKGEEFLIAEELCFWTNNTAIKPANKKQRFILFEKMSDSGYEWNANTRKVYKLAQITDDDYVDCSLKELFNPDGNTLESSDDTKDDLWTKGDDEMLIAIQHDIEELKDDSEFPVNEEFYQIELDWLKTIKRRIMH